MLSFFVCHGSNPRSRVETDKNSGGGATYNGSVLSNEKKNVILITKEDIEKKSYKSLVDIFEDSPVTIVTHTQAGPLIALRGSGEKTVMRVKVLLDGTSISTIDEFMGIIPFNAIPVNSVEKIEIIPGGGITLYGSGSSSGVINIVTKSDKAKDYGSVNVTGSSFYTYNINFNKGISLGEHFFTNFAIEGQQGKGYRDKDKSKKINALAGFEVKFNDRNKMRISGMKYKEDADTTNEINIYDLKKNRRRAGDTLSNVRSDRDSLSLDYYYKPKENIEISTSFNKSKFTRKISQDSHPVFTFLPSIDFFDDAFSNTKERIDLVLVNVPRSLEGKFEEKIENARFKTNYDYHQGKGKLSFGFDYLNHRLKRESTSITAPYNEYANVGLLIHKKNERMFSEERIRENPDMLINYSTMQADSVYSTPEDHYFKNPFGREGIEDIYIDNHKFKLEKKLAKLLYPYATSEMIEKYEKVADTQGVTALVMQFLSQGMDIMPIMTEINRWYQTTFRKEKMSTLINPNTLVEKDGKKGFYVKDISSDKAENVFFEVKENTTFEDFIRFEETLNSPKSKTTSFVSSQVDTKKKSNSFYLHNSYDITDKFELSAGLRYEETKYKGNRKTRTHQMISLDPGMDWKKEAYSTIDVLDMYTQTSDILYTERQNRTEDQLGFMILEKLRRLEELKETGKTIIPMANLLTAYHRKEKNIGGDIGFTYRLNDTNKIYAKYERAFNTPLPTQMTNKTFDPIHKVRVYWESNIQTEKMNNFEIGFRGMLDQNITFSAAAFLSDTYDEIVSVVKDGNSHDRREWRFVNIDKTRRMGIELQSEQSFERLRLKESITYIHPKILSNDFKEEVRKIAKEQTEQLIHSRRNSIERYFRESMRDIPDREKILREMNHFYQEDYYKKNIGNKDAMKDYIDKYVKEKIDSILDASSIENSRKEKLKDGIRNNLENDRNYVENIRKQYDYEYALENGEFLKEGDTIPLAPKIKATFGADYQFTDKLKLGMNFNYIGSYTTVEPARGYEIIKTKVPSHLVSDFYGTYDWSEDFSIKFGINNVFNHEYNLRQDSTKATPAPGRTYSAGFSYRF